MSAPDTLMTLEQAAALPRLGGLVDVRALRRATTHPLHPLPTTVLGRRHLTTPTWIDRWIDSCRRVPDLPDPAAAPGDLSPPGSGTRRAATSGVSSTPSQARGSKTALAAARATAQELRRISRTISKDATEKPPKQEKP